MLAAWQMFFLWSRPGCVRRSANRTRAPRSPSSARTASRCSVSDRTGDVVRYATLGMSAQPMTDPTAALADPVKGPRAELVLSVRAGLADTDKVLRPLAVLAASPQVEGVVVAPGASLDVGEPLWPGAPFTSVLVAEPGGLVEDLELDEPLDPVRFLPLLPMTPNEAAWKRVHGAAGAPGALAARTARTCAIRCAGPVTPLTD